VIIHRLNQALSLLLLILPSLPAHAESAANLPVSILPNLVDLDSGARAAFAGSPMRSTPTPPC
jgi:hypothetical protein